MALVVNTNVASITSQMYVNKTNKDMSDTMARLSSGKRINSAADDAAGVAIASRLSSEIRGTNQAVRNALDAQGLINTAEGAHKEVETILQRMRELAVQSANDTNDSTDRTNLDAEMQQLVEEIDRISGVTTWAGQNLLDGSNVSGFNFQIGGRTNAEDVLNVNINSVSAAALGLSGSGSTASASSSLTGTSFASSFDGTTDAITITAAATGQGAVAAQGAVTAVQEVQSFDLSGSTIAATNSYTMTIGSTELTATALGSADATGLLAGLKLDADYAGSGVTLSLQGTDRIVATFAATGDQLPITLTRGGDQLVTASGTGPSVLNIAATTANGVTYGAPSDGYELTVGSVTLTAAAGTYTDAAALVTALKADPTYANSGFTLEADTSTPNQINIAVNTTGAVTASLKNLVTTEATSAETVKGVDAQSSVTAQDAVVMETVTIAMGSQSFDVELDTSTYNTAADQASQIASVLNSDSSFSAQFTATANNGTISFTGLADTTFNVRSVPNSRAAINTIDAAISTINTQRANLGAYSNRLDNTVSNLSNIAINLEDGRSRIEDADFAAESANLAKNQILLQAGTAMLAQANASKQNVLSLLG